MQLKQSDGAMLKVVPGPYRWVSQADVWHLRSLVGFPVELGVLADAALASRGRTRVWEAAAAGEGAGSACPRS